MNALNKFLVTQRQMTLKDVCGYVMLESYIGNVCWTLFSLILLIH